MQKYRKLSWDFFGHDAAGGIVLMLAALMALVITNSPIGNTYQHFLDRPFTMGVSPVSLEKSLHHWVNDGLMVIFFFLVGLELKRELLVGALSEFKTALLPAIAAIGGMLVPAVIYAAWNWHDPVALHGWAIPSATDIAFAIGVVALLGSRVPASLKAFLLALAIIDDLGAIVIIAIFYTQGLSFQALLLAAVGAAGLLILNLRNYRRVGLYLLVGGFVWVCVLKSGVHATLAGVVTALAIPLKGGSPYETVSPLEDLEHRLTPWVKFFIVPAFALANAGVAIGELGFEDLAHPISAGIATGLVAGKAVGVFGFSYLAIKMGLAPLPAGASHLQLLGIALLAGIGFTMSLFIGLLAFPDPSYMNEVKIGVLAGSMVAGLSGYLLLRACGRTSR